MKINKNSFVMFALLNLLIFSCGKNKNSDSNEEDEEKETENTPTSAGTLSILASNILIPVANAKTLEEQYPNVNLAQIDTETKIPAANVILIPYQGGKLNLAGNNTNSIGRLKSGNLKDALEKELAFDLKAGLIGTWSIVNKNQEDLHSGVGKITFKKDGTFHLESGSFAAIGQGSGDTISSKD